ncbi:MAG: NifU family protein [Chloroflexi bacterium]|nr:NifU family protein [Chloroflexota bacterium]MBI4503949.1 NifU family protein [Chloroflexota bacterium]
MRDTIEAVLEKFRPGMQADGADLALGSIAEDGSVDVRLIIGPETCLECLLPDDDFARMLEFTFRDEGAAVKAVRITRQDVAA